MMYQAVKQEYPEFVHRKYMCSLFSTNTAILDDNIKIFLIQQSEIQSLSEANIYVLNFH